MKIASIQLNIAWEDREENLRRAAKFIRRAMDDGCDLVVFPEMFNSGFSMNVEATAEKKDGQTVKTLCRLAKEHNINLIAGYTEKGNPKSKNVGLYIGRDGIIKGRYVKNYPFSLTGEGDYVAAGNKQVLFEVDGVKSSLFICYDLRFPELFRRVAGEIEIIFVIANWSAARQDHWESLLKARAIENQCFIVGVNRTGTGGNGVEYAGGSHVFGPFGDDLSRGRKNQEYIITEIYTSEVGGVRKKFPFLQDIKQN